ncbi:MAG: AmmeMemoRadiSam system radical SAM enzyme [Rhodospirillaceae bacterium]|nr:AmmeMemoRadiSam system radical SAM enzyme [Magnetovibrio sp.]MAY68484.1 AmmeMemoRadiSam system radical SAM enzyme [Rhodospirillaceae bacterium]
MASAETEIETFPGAVPGRYWHKLADGRIQCDVCPRFCKMRAGQRGLCFVRASDGEQVVLTTYGRSSGFCIDPIEKKPLNHFYPGTPILSFGTAGCNLTCKFCQNYDISKSREFDKLQSVATPAMIAEAAVQSGCKSVAYTYNDPVIFLEYAIDTAKECRKRGIKNAAVTAGYITPDARREFFQYMDAANVDLKAFTPEFYKELCSADLEQVKETLVYIKHETDCWLEITDLVIPGRNDSDAEIEEMTQWIVSALGPDVPVHFTAFHPDWKMMDVPPTPPETLIRAREIALKNGIRYAYTGNVHDKDHQSTYCHNCGGILIGRDWYELSEFNVTTQGNYPGNCAACGAEIPGRFDGPAGTWGRKRQPLRFRPRPA